MTEGMAMEAVEADQDDRVVQINNLLAPGMGRLGMSGPAKNRNAKQEGEREIFFHQADRKNKR